MVLPGRCSPASPDAFSSTSSEPAEGQTSQATLSAATSAFVDRPLRDSALSFDGLDNLIELRLNYNAAHNHFAQCGMQGFEVEDQVELADVFEEAIEGLDEDLDEVEQSKR